ncbi:MAG: hypothetical protein EP330_23330 [Deltaproteobacteria bacterium]|nr:MAG: hypothetical protein EP330_23330 [Deltaproteobacteria bacterium]
MTLLEAQPVGLHGLEIRLIGDTSVARDGESLALPPSQKTRALLAYLVLTRRAQTREHLCDLLWHQADDPRGALRWSLSRLRATLDTKERTWVVANRRDVGLDLDGAHVDALAARDALAEPESLSTEELETHAEALDGELVADLVLDEQPELGLWLAAERERFRGLALLARRTLVDRYADHPEAAIPHARALVRADPLDEEARARLIRLLGATGRLDEAEAQMQAARAARREIGAQSTGEVGRAWKDVRTAPAPRVAPRKVAPGRRDVAGLVGRGPELAWLIESMEAVLGSGHGRVLLMTGEPGVGKSRLLNALLENARSRGVAVLHGRAHEVELRAYGPWVDALRQQPVLGERPWSERLAPLLGGVEPGAGGKEQLFAGVGELVEHLAGEGGVVVALDDVHWADAASTALVHWMVRTLAHRPVLTVLVARGGELAAHEPLQRSLAGLRRDLPLDTRALGPLDVEDTAALVRAIDPEANAGEIHRQSAGNPLLSLELARARQTRGDGVSAVIRDRLLSIPEDARDLLRWAAVLGSAFDVSRLGAVAPGGADAVVNALGTLQTHALLVDENDGRRVAFAHDLVWRTVYDDLAAGQRRLMHGRVAQVLGEGDLRDPEVAAELARHAELAGDASAAARACVLAGQHCLRVFANTEARALAVRGLRCAAELRDPEKVEREIELETIALAAEPPQDLDATLARLDDLGQRAIDFGSAAHARNAYMTASTLRYERNQWVGALRDSLRAERIGRLADPGARSTALGETARCLILLERDLPQADAMAREARALARTVGRATAAVPLSLGMLATWRGDADEATQLFEESRRAADRDGDRFFAYYALEQHVMLCLHQGRPLEAEMLALDLVRIGDRIREGSEAAFARVLLGLARLAGGDARAFPEVAEGIDALELADARSRVGYSQTRLAGHALAMGRAEEAAVRAQAGLDAALLLRRPSEEVFARVQLAKVAMARGDRDAVEAQRVSLLHNGLPVSCAWSRADLLALAQDLGWPTP